MITRFETFLSKYFFGNQPVQLNAIKHDHIEEVFVKIGLENEFPIQQLGDGIQSIILLTFPLFDHQDKAGHLVFYEEPELYMHPGMQRIFVDVIRSFKNAQCFIVTHSNHLIDSSLDRGGDVYFFF